MVKTATNQNGDMPKRWQLSWPKRRQTKTPKGKNGDKPKRRQEQCVERSV